MEKNLPGKKGTWTKSHVTFFKGKKVSWKKSQATFILGKKTPGKKSHVTYFLEKKVAQGKISTWKKYEIPYYHLILIIL